MDNFIRSKDIHSTVLQMLSSEEFNKMLSTTYGADDKSYRAGAMFGAAMTAIYITNHADSHNLRIQCNCGECIFRQEGHPDRSYLPCQSMRDTDYCNYGIRDKSLETDQGEG